MITRRRSLHLLGAATLGMASGRRLLAGTNGRMPDGCASVTVPCLGEPYVDIDEWRGQPVRHRYIHGGFKGTQARFSLYFPPKAQYQGRFFQYITPVPIREDLAHQGFGAHNGIGFAIESGAYAVATNEGGTDATATPGARVDPSIAGYRVNAAAAQYSRVIAARIYGPHRPYGYAYGGSGGSYRTIAGFENTTAWDGAVPYVMPCPMAIPSVFTPRLFAMRVLKDRFGQIVDAIDPGGSGDMYAGLNEEERETLREATAMGFPPRTWFAHQTLGMGAFAVLFDHVVRMDPQYFVDFWTVPGYLGANPPKSLLDARIRHKTVVTRVIMSNEAAAMGLPGPATAGRPSASAATAWENLQRRAGRAIPAGLELEEPPRGDPAGATILVRRGAAAGRTFMLESMVRDVAMISSSPTAAQAAHGVVAAIRPGDEIAIDNSNFLAVQTYHRHQVPTPDYYVWDQFRGPDGMPIYPQRPKLLGPEFEFAATGVRPLQTGRFQGKMIVVESLMDPDALPWQADWYRTRVRENLGSQFDDHFRLWFTDHAVHTADGWPQSPTHVVPYLGVLQQALRDLSAWVERGIAPPASTSYRIDNGQVVVPAAAADRKGVQPVVTLTANGGTRAEVRVGQSVALHAAIAAPPGAGKIVAVEWYFEGDEGGAPVIEKLADEQAKPQVRLQARHAFSKPGTYFPALRAILQRDEFVGTPYARIYNIGRARVVVG